jgi:single-stranded DNA-binding protein
MTLTGYNHVCCIGTISNGPWHNPGREGRAESAALTLGITELGKEEKEYTTYVRVECYGRVVSDALALRQGDTVLVEGKLSWSKGSGEGKAGLCVLAWRLMPLTDYHGKHN